VAKFKNRTIKPLTQLIPLEAEKGQELVNISFRLIKLALNAGRA